MTEPSLTPVTSIIDLSIPSELDKFFANCFLPPWFANSSIVISILTVHSIFSTAGAGVGGISLPDGRSKLSDSSERTELS